MKHRWLYQVSETETAPWALSVSMEPDGRTRNVSVDVYSEDLDAPDHREGIEQFPYLGVSDVVNRIATALIDSGLEVSYTDLQMIDEQIAGMI